jgi:hypothetical protein
MENQHMIDQSYIPVIAPGYRVFRSRQVPIMPEAKQHDRGQLITEMSGRRSKPSKTKHSITEMSGKACRKQSKTEDLVVSESRGKCRKRSSNTEGIVRLNE